MKYRKIFFIDPGTNYGWAISENGKVSSGADSLPCKPGQKVLKFWYDLAKLAPTGTGTSDLLLVWEEAAFSRYHTASRMYGMWEGLLVLFCELHRIPYMAVNVSSIKKYIREQGYCDDKEKPRAREEWKLTASSKLQEHEIDALWGLEYVIHQLSTKNKK